MNTHLKAGEDHDKHTDHPARKQRLPESLGAEDKAVIHLCLASDHGKGVNNILSHGWQLWLCLVHLMTPDKASIRP